MGSRSPGSSESVHIISIPIFKVPLLPKTIPYFYMRILKVRNSISIIIQPLLQLYFGLDFQKKSAMQLQEEKPYIMEESDDKLEPTRTHRTNGTLSVTASNLDVRGSL